MTLEALQHRLWDTLVGARPIEDAADLVTAGALSPTQRLDLYAEMYWLRLRDVLRSEFPLVRAVLGPDDFDVLAARYVRAHPSRHHSLDWLGQSLAGFLREGPVDQAPFLADLAELEFTRNQAFLAPDAPVATSADLARVTPDTAMTARFSLTPSVRVLRLEHDVRPLFRALSEGQAWTSSEAPATSTCLVIFRAGFTVFHDAVSADEAAALALARDGASLPELCAAFSGDDAAARAFQAIGSWVSEGLVSRIAT
jgi:hypothetical protein